jgi:ABC-type uncharacterized transport system permease subunit
MNRARETLMSESKPYAFKGMSPFVGPVQGSPTESLNRSIQALIETRPWVRIMGVLASIVVFVVIYAITKIMNGIDWLFAEPQDDLASLVMRFPMRRFL